jgi:hypothetical protein
MLGGTKNSTQLGYVSIAMILGTASWYLIYFANGCMWFMCDCWLVSGHWAKGMVSKT